MEQAELPDRLLKITSALRCWRQSVLPVPCPAAACPPLQPPPPTPPHNSTRHWLLDCEIGGGGGGNATGSRRCEPDVEVRTERGRRRGSGERMFARGEAGGRSGICAAERGKRGGEVGERNNAGGRLISHLR